MIAINAKRIFRWNFYYKNKLGIHYRKDTNGVKLLIAMKIDQIIRE